MNLTDLKRHFSSEQLPEYDAVGEDVACWADRELLYNLGEREGGREERGGRVGGEGAREEGGGREEGGREGEGETGWKGEGGRKDRADLRCHPREGTNNRYLCCLKMKLGGPKITQLGQYAQLYTTGGGGFMHTHLGC